MVIGCAMALSACGSNGDKDVDTKGDDTAKSTGENTATANDNLKNVKIGFICLHDEKSTYDLNFINAAKTAQANLGLSDDQVIIKTNVPESNECYEAAAELADMGCNIVFADSFGHEDFIIKAAKEFTDVQF